jgi:NADPH2:quinone reductase
MKAILTDQNKNLLWSDVPDPVLHDHEVLVKISAAALNRADLMQRNGEYPPPEGWPEWMGLEIAGVIVSVGTEAAKKSNYKVGDNVCALLGGGGYAEYAVVPYELLMPIPHGFTMEEAASIPEVYATAYLDLVLEGNLQRGETVLVHAGASGVGIAATQIAKSAGARVIVTVRSDEKAEEIRKYGADHIVNSKKEDVRGIFERYDIDLVLDCVGGKLMGECFGKMARYGRWIMIATLGGNVTEIDLKTLYAKRLKLIGSTLRSRTLQEKANILRSLVEHIYPHFEKGEFKPVIYKVLPVKDAETAHRILERNENIGKVVLKISDC